MDDLFHTFPSHFTLLIFFSFFFSASDFSSYSVEKVEENFCRIPQSHLPAFASTYSYGYVELCVVLWKGISSIWA